MRCRELTQRVPLLVYDAVSWTDAAYGGVRPRRDGPTTRSMRCELPLDLNLDLILDRSLPSSLPLFLSSSLPL
eukprot:2013982-Rhodomonas_salina.2